MSLNDHVVKGVSIRIVQIVDFQEKSLLHHVKVTQSPLNRETARFDPSPHWIGKFLKPVRLCGMRAFAYVRLQD